MNALVGALKVTLGLDSAAFSRGAKTATAQADALGKGIGKSTASISGLGKAAIAAGAALAASAIVSTMKDMVVQGLEYASALGETAQQLGVSTKALQQYRYAATQVGLSQEEMEKNLAMLTKRMGEAANGVKKPAEAFDRLGIDIKAFIASGKDAGDLIPVIAEGLKGFSSDAEKAAVVTDLFGRSGQKLMPLLSEGAQGVNALRDSAHKLGLVMDDALIRKADDAADKISALQEVMKVRLSVAVAENVDSILSLADALSQLIAKASGAVRSYKLWRLEVGVKQQTSLAEGWFTSDADAAKALKRAKQYQAEIDRLNGKKKTIGGPGLGGGIQNPIGQRSTPKAPVVWPTVPLRKTLPANSPFLNNTGGDILKQRLVEGAERLTSGPGIAGALDAIGASAESATSGLKNVSAANDNLVKSAKLAIPELAALMDRLFPEEAKAREYRAEVAQIGEAVKLKLIPPLKAAAALKALALEGLGNDTLDNFLSGSGQSLEADDILPFEVIQHKLSILTKGLVETSSRAKIETVKVEESFKDMAEGVLSSLNQLTGAIQGGGFLNILSSVIGLGLQLGGAGLFGDKIKANINASPRAFGGTAMAGRMHLVGERGPELFVPGRTGSVVPNKALSGGNTYVFKGNLMTPEFWARIQSGDIAAANAGGNIGVAKVRQAGNWKLR